MRSIRDANKCREKWTNFLDPTLSRAPFSADEDVFLVGLVKQLGRGAWAETAQYFPGRSDRDVTLRWKKLAGEPETNNAAFFLYIT